MRTEQFSQLTTLSMVSTTRVKSFEFWGLRFRVLGCFVFEFRVFVFEFWALRFRDLGASCFGLRFRVLRFRNYPHGMAYYIYSAHLAGILSKTFASSYTVCIRAQSGLAYKAVFRCLWLYPMHYIMLILFFLRLPNWDIDT